MSSTEPQVLRQKLLDTGLFDVCNENYIYLVLIDTKFFFFPGGVNYPEGYWRHSPDGYWKNIKATNFKNVFDTVSEILKEDLIWHMDLLI